MSRLAQQQQILLDALFAWPAANAMKIVANESMDTGARGLKAYKANGHALAASALQSAYPVVAQLVGDESFTDLAHALWHAQPPAQGDIAQWGMGLSGFLENSAQLQDEPYLADVARVEWALHQCAGVADAEADLATLALLTTQAPEQLQLRLAPGCAVLRSTWPVASIVGAHLEGSPSLQEAGAQLRRGEAQDTVVWRAGLRPRVRLALAGEVDALQVLLNGGSLAAALDAAPTLDFGQWLPLAVPSGLVLGVVAVDTAGPVAQT
ncbi:putative DNA-binding domain-containing protein [Rhodoferax sp. AJA081-3]|uniref:HvfC/BufC family peptide modification chaperone n=1 Tax=Rhodoferax sp. AJA081-3 TaxID=2752316 RepID=UPI001ADFBD2D|nr:putative DNA-binding domain-containing protein [Rhodoferax sp. AJA081-3]QTN26572.1 putative DNA-binding domain-containing protein [Rhodoferax sp. AJA081-3]